MDNTETPLLLDDLRSHINRYVDLTDQTFAASARYFTSARIGKSQFLLREGEPCRLLAFVARGCLRLYSVDSDGAEHILQFALDGWWISDLYSFLTAEPSTYYIDALETSDLLLIDHNGYEDLCSLDSQFDRFFRLLLQNHHIATHRRIRASLSMSAEDLYLSMVEQQPDLLQRVAQRHIASYLGITPEYLSRIRKHIAAERKART